MLELYQLPISHYCEKVRWALDYKDLDYRKRNLLPGLHARKAKKLTSQSSVPILVHDGEVVYGSSRIVDYLDSTFKNNPLTPDDQNLAKSALEWERFADEEIGPRVRLLCYHILLDHPNIVIPFMTDNGPWYGPFLIKRIFPRLSLKMRALMKINDKTFDVSKIRLGVAIDKVCERLQGREFLVGENFTRADLAIASLLARFSMPEKYGLNWPDSYPQELDQLIQGYSNILYWVSDLYKNYR